MKGWFAIGALAVLFGSTNPIAAQRPRLGFGFGGGVILGSQLLDHGFAATMDGRSIDLVQQVDLNDMGVASANIEWYVTRHITLRGHAAWGSGRLEIHTLGESTDDLGALVVESEPGDVGISAFDAGVSLWPWAPRSIGFAPFATVGIGTFNYDFDATDANGFFRATGSRSGRAVLVGIGADMSVWRSITLRMEAVNHRVESPLRPSDFNLGDETIVDGEIDETVSNVRLVLGAHVYLPFTTTSVGKDH